MVRKSNLAKGKMRTKVVTRVPNKGDLTKFKGSPSGKPWPVRVLHDKGGDSTLRNNPGVKFGKKKKK